MAEIVKHSLKHGITRIKYKHIPQIVCMCFRNDDMTIITRMNKRKINKIQAHNAIHELINLAEDETTFERTIEMYMHVFELTSNTAEYVPVKKYSSREIIDTELCDILAADKIVKRDHSA